MPKGSANRSGTVLDGILSFLDTTVPGSARTKAAVEQIRKRNAAALQKAIDEKALRDGQIRKKAGG